MSRTATDRRRLPCLPEVIGWARKEITHYGYTAAARRNSVSPTQILACAAGAAMSLPARQSIEIAYRRAQAEAQEAA